MSDSAWVKFQQLAFAVCALSLPFILAVTVGTHLYWLAALFAAPAGVFLLLWRIDCKRYARGRSR